MPVDRLLVAQVAPERGQVVLGVQSRIGQVDLRQFVRAQRRALGHRVAPAVPNTAVVAPAVSPPSTTNSCPVTKAARWSARKWKNSAISSGEACRPAGMLRLVSSSISSVYSARCIGVSTAPGDTQATRTCGLSSRANVRASAAIPALVAL